VAFQQGLGVIRAHRPVMHEYLLKRYLLTLPQLFIGFSLFYELNSALREARERHSGAVKII
jgi:hypothetical protein